MVATPSLAPGETDLYKICEVIRWLLQGLGGPAGFGREVLQADRTYYVRTDGNDSNVGTVNTASGAFLTIQRAVNVALALDGRTFNIAINVADGTYAETVTIAAPALTTGTFSITGNTTTPANVLVSSFVCRNSAIVTLGGFKLTGTVGLQATTFANVSVTSLMQYSATGVQVQATVFSNITISASYTVNAVTAGFHLLATFFGSIQVTSAATATWSAPTFTTANIFASTYAQILFQGNVAAGSSATGTRYFVDVFSTINSSARGENFFPGTVAGQKSNGGTYI